MRLSTSSSDPRRTQRYVILLLVAIVIFCVALEVVTIRYFGRISHIRHRIEEEEQAALVTHSTSGPVSVLLIGNSLLLNGVEMPMLIEEMNSNYRTTRFVLESTGYIDWYYGMRKLFREGARPQVVILMLSPSQFVSNRTAGDYFAQVLMDRRDLFRVASDTAADRTTTTNLLFDNLSTFYGSRNEIRNWLFAKVLSDADTLADRFRPPTARPTSNKFLEIADARMAAMRDLFTTYGSQLIVVTPPSPAADNSDLLRAAGITGGVPVLVPLEPGALDNANFKDGFHLTSEGAIKFTRALGPALKDHLDRKLALALASERTTR
jgi:hypothetical protein